MLKNSLSKSYNLLVSFNYFPNIFIVTDLDLSSEFSVIQEKMTKIASWLKER